MLIMLHRRLYMGQPCDRSGTSDHRYHCVYVCDS